jgi:hypothetical protein
MEFQSRNLKCKIIMFPSLIFNFSICHLDLYSLTWTGVNFTRNLPRCIQNNRQVITEKRRRDVEEDPSMSTVDVFVYRGNHARHQPHTLYGEYIVSQGE